MVKDSTELYERIGGADAIRATVAKLYEKILGDALLVPFFENIDVERLRRSQAAFVTKALGGPAQYSGEGLRKAHRSLVARGLSDEHFDAVVRHLKAAMEELGVSEELIAEAITIVESTRSDVLNK